jgi:hypothetical protein
MEIAVENIYAVGLIIKTFLAFAKLLHNPNDL